MPPGPRYRRLVVLGAGETALRALHDLADEVTDSADALRDADAIAVTSRSGLALGDLLRQVRDDAVLYLEIDRRRRGRRLLSPTRLTGMLRRVGFKVTSCHWVVPAFDQARRHVPLDASAVLQWYFDTLHTAGSPAARLVEIGLRLLARTGPERMAAAVPCYSVVAVGPENRSVPGGVLAPLAAPLAMLTSGQDDGSRVVLLPFDNGAHPSRVVKVARLPTFAEHTEREQRTLVALRERLPLSLRSSVPEPLGVHRWRGMLVASERYAPGAPLVVSTGRFGGSSAAGRDDLRCTVDWLIAFQQATRNAGRGWSNTEATRAGERLARCRALLPGASAAHALLGAASVAAADLVGHSLPMVPLHNDLGPWNVHRDGERVTVIDWELGERPEDDRTGPGPCDLFYFTTYWYLRVRHLRAPNVEVRGIRELHIDAPGRRPAAAVHEEILRYAGAFDLDTRFLPLLLVLTWTERALERVERAGANDARSLSGENRYLRFLETLAERTQRWFGEGCWP